MWVRHPGKIILRELEKIGKGYLGTYKNGKYKHPKLAPAILKYGWNNFILEKTLTNLSADEANELERYYIKLYNSNGEGGYNVLDGGKSNYTHKLSETDIKLLALRAKETYNYEAHYKKVYQFDKNSLDLIKTWPSIVSASKELGVSKTTITGCCRGVYVTAGGYIWSYTNNIPENHFKGRRIKRVYQLDIDGKFLKSYYSICEAANCTGISKTNIRAALTGEYYSSGGFRWSYSKNPIDRTSLSNSKKIYMFSTNGTFIKEYMSISEAAKENDVTAASITEAAKEINRLRTSAGYIWSYSRILDNEKLINKRVVPILKYSISGEFMKEYPSIIDAARENNIDKSLLTKCCKGKIKTSGRLYMEV